MCHIGLSLRSSRASTLDLLRPAKAPGSEWTIQAPWAAGGLGRRGFEDRLFADPVYDGHDQPEAFPVTAAISDTVLRRPIHPGVPAADCAHVSDILRAAAQP